MISDYDFIPNFKDPKGKKVLGKEVTKTFGKLIADKINSELKVRDLNFPRFRMPRLKAFGYKAKHYYDIAKYILDEKIRVYETKEDVDKLGFRAVYNDADLFIFTPTIVNYPDLYFPTIIHEATHAIQDDQKWKESQRDREVDAHFAQAFIMILMEKENLPTTERLEDFKDIAKEVKKNPRYFLKSEFVQQIPSLCKSIHHEYRYKQSDKEKFDLTFTERERTNGIGV